MREGSARATIRRPGSVLQASTPRPGNRTSGRACDRGFVMCAKTAYDSGRTDKIATDILQVVNAIDDSTTDVAEFARIANHPLLWRGPFDCDVPSCEVRITSIRTS